MLKALLTLVLLLPADVAELVKRLGDDDAARRDAAERELADVGEGALAELDEAAGSDDAELAARARRVAGAIRQDLELRRPHDTRESWERVFAGARPGTPVAPVVRLGRRLRSLGIAGDETSWSWDGTFYYTWRLDTAWRVWVECAREDPDTVKEVRIIGFEDLREEFGDDWELCRAIHESGELSLAFDPARCIRAVNALHAAGKARALEACQHYLRTFRHERVLRLKFDINPQRLFPILRLLFTGADGKPLLPAPDMGTWTLAPPAGADAGTFPVLVVDDVPFIVSEWFCINGTGEEPDDQLTRCARDGVLRAKPLSPAGSPIAAADQLVAGDAFKTLKPGEGCLVADIPQWIRLQAARAVGMSRQDIRTLTLRIAGKPRAEQEAVWSGVRDALEEKKPRWDGSKGAFVPGK